ncbi:Calcium/calmodulin-dependent protein kinase type 1D [Tulasnella sp. JGI-2019a]|nr:Calcium/calmodulin-dependent protein kinase type 1D [Tulasnella sp. JGI-2019a]
MGLRHWFRIGEHQIAFFMSLATAKTLADYPVDELPVTQALVLLVQIMDAAIYMHGKRCTHRDLKPSNILLTGAGEALKAMVCDFGISKRGLTHTCKSGTPGFIAPEVLTEHTHNNKVDSYAIGLIAWHLLFGRTYFKGDDQRAGVLDWGVLKRPQSRRIPSGAEDFLLKLLAREPRERWTVEMARMHPLVRSIASTTTTGPAANAGTSVSESAGPSNGTVLVSPLVPVLAPLVATVPTIQAVNPRIIRMERDAAASVDPPKGMLWGNGPISRILHVTGAVGVSPSAGSIAGKRKREFSASTSGRREVVAADDSARSVKRRKAIDSGSIKRKFAGKAAWPLNRVRGDADGLVKSTWTAAPWVKRG